jgi:hypothetical protein
MKNRRTLRNGLKFKRHSLNIQTELILLVKRENEKISLFDEFTLKRVRSDIIFFKTFQLIFLIFLLLIFCANLI